ncbi:outer membrane cobalamin receptor [Dysgonomonas sp. PFB1-18]|uniref:TonB-dependent receptor plug domain-containing protein n=1 Tax=unclassified Dysgonomonas TaxID=2630389 RepID=UPI002475A6AF|nr:MULTISPECIES: TonB-dependent receptor [unclassified Dysgonomonas]MDH6310975.1 outer membrane cobalamin receptor [Dysgonomonas sp. PF1-14]MDH6340810.1 outer membrane cobalamin receptor [Dysgonomonas sp. PF1-16]MDH6382404.1 outer membrane cobalamin receptor [Dysgonomonas sp. PFB1-18]MDH6399779.1 outer membrane cobalamin receptor [Dysgonomonas sp. PF1-23]
MKKHIFRFLLLSSSCWISAQEVSRDTISLNEITIVSTTKTQIARSQVPATVSVVSRSEIEDSGESAVLSVLSGRVPGLFVTERSTTGFGVSSGSAGAVNIRGVGSGNKVLMLLDGQPQWAGLFGHHLPDAYVSSDAEKAEVIRGPGSLLYGSNAMGGVINVISRRPHLNGIHGQGQIQYGSYNTQKYMANAGLYEDRLNAFVSINHNRTDGHRDNSKFYITNGFAKAGYKISPNWDFSGNAMIAKFKTNNPGSITQPMIENWADVLRSSYSVSVENDYGKTSGAVKAFYNYGNHEVNDGWKNGKPREYLFQSRDHNAGIMAYQSLRLFSGNLVTAGLDYKNWGGKAWNQYPDRDDDLADKSVNETAVYLLIQQSLFKSLTLNAGVRLEMNDVFGNEWIPQAGIAYRVSDNTTLKTSLSKGFRSPNIRELYMFIPANPDLKPESMMSYDFSVLHELIERKLNLEFTAFFIDGKDMIQQISIDGKPKNINTGSFINKGFEFAVNYRIMPGLKLMATYSYLYTDKPIVAAPKHMAFVEANYKTGAFSFNLNSQYIDGLYTVTGNNPRTENYLLFNGRIVYQLTKQVSFFVNGENLTARKYMINDGFPMPKATFMSGVNFTF